MLLMAACQYTEVPPPGGPLPQPANCGDGVCDTQSEDCFNCSKDCSCCSAVTSNGSGAPVQGEENGVGEADGKFVELAENSVLTLVLGRAIYNDLLGTAPDFKLIGSVESQPTDPSGLCSTSSQGTQAFEVQASDDGLSYRVVGFWTSANDQEFDIGCAQMRSARFIRLQGQPGARAKLDAVLGLPSSCLSQ